MPSKMRIGSRLTPKLVAGEAETRALSAKYPSGQNPLANPKYVVLNFSQKSIDSPKLAFLGATSGPQLILELDVAQENYRNALFHREFGACVKKSRRACSGRQSPREQ